MSDLTILHEAVLETPTPILDLDDLRELVHKTQGWNGAALVEHVKDWSDERKTWIQRITVRLGGKD